MSEYRYIGAYEIMVLCASFHGIVKKDDVIKITDQEAEDLGTHLFEKVSVKVSKESKKDG